MPLKPFKKTHGEPIEVRIDTRNCMGPDSWDVINSKVEEGGIPVDGDGVVVQKYDPEDPYVLIVTYWPKKTV